MKRRSVAALLLMVLMPLPLLCLWFLAIRGPTSHTEDPRLVPMLADWQRDQLLTYESECRQQEDCAAPLKCFMHPMNGHYSCVDSRCMKDEDCPTQFRCQTLSSGDESLLVRRCVPLSKRHEGEPCDPLPYDQQRGCVTGLLCQHDWCGRPCDLDTASSCPPNFFCAPGAHGPSCLPTCKGRTCPQGRECIEYQANASICAEIHGQNCERTPCPEEQSCHYEEISHHADAVWMSCRVMCDGTKRPCADQQVCFNGLCREACDLEGPNTCGPHRRCGQRHQEASWCMPDL
jgi:hypothetical protein